MRVNNFVRLAFAILLFPAGALAQDFGEGRWVDLTHDFSDETISHPRGQPFVHTPSVVGMTPGGFYMATYNYSGSEHVGTHLDAPVHFHEGGKSIEQLSLQRFMGDVVVIDVRNQVAADKEYLVTVDDVLQWEATHGKIPDDSIVLFNMGLARAWPDKIKYTGTDKRGNEGVAELKNPAIHKDTALFLSTQRRIKLVGLDTTSFDNARQSDRRSHRIFFEHDIPGIENVANIDALPATGAFMIALPMKIKDGSAAPVRVIAFVPDNGDQQPE
jgi:kynurenine formamidase